MAYPSGSFRFFEFCLLALFASIQLVVGPPAVIKVQEHNNSLPSEHAPSDDSFDLQHDLEYSRYLKEVVETLESDPEFRKKLETAEEHDFRNGKVASELEYVNHHVRTKLDELKRTEIQRLRDLIEKKNDVERRKDHHIHLDHGNLETFEVKDLQMLMDKVRKDLEEADKMRRENFKEYELEKEFEKNQKLKEMDEEHQKTYLKQEEEEKKKLKHHDPLHHPGSKAQLEEVWEKGDHMDNQQFQPLAFFHLHDVDGNGYWDEQEVNALFLKELDKIYKDHPNADLREREEEMERMREHVFSEVDTNRDRLISFREFFDQTKKEEFQRDEGWETLDQRPQFSQQEYEAFERQRQLQMQGHLPPHPPGVAYPHPQQVPVYHQYGGQIPQHQGPQFVAPQYNQYQTVNQVPVGQPQAAYHIPGQPPASLHHQQQPPPAHPQYQYQQPQVNQIPQSGQPIQPGHVQQSNHPPQPNQGQFNQPPPASQGQFNQHPPASQEQFKQQPPANQAQFNQQPPANQAQFNQQAQPVQGQFVQQPQQTNQQPPVGQHAQPVQAQFVQQPQQTNQQPPIGQQHQPNSQPSVNQYQQPPQMNQYQQPTYNNVGQQPVAGNQAVPSAQLNNIPQPAVNVKLDSKEPKRR